MEKSKGIFLLIIGFIILLIPPKAEGQQLADSAFLYSNNWDNSNYHIQRDFNPVTDDYKKESTAVFLSFKITLGTYVAGSVLDDSETSKHRFNSRALKFSGFIIGPSFGSLYAKDGPRAMRGMLIRGGVVAILKTGLIGNDDENPDRGSLDSGAGGSSLTAIAVSAGVISMFYDFFRSNQKSVAKYNLRVDEGASFHASPWIDIDTGAPGLSASLRF